MKLRTPQINKKDNKEKKQKGYWASVRRGAIIGAALPTAYYTPKAFKEMGDAGLRTVALGGVATAGGLAGAGVGGLIGLRKTKKDDKYQRRTKDYALRLGALSGVVGLGANYKKPPNVMLRRGLKEVMGGALVGGMAGSAENAIRKDLEERNKYLIK